MVSVDSTIFNFGFRLEDWNGNLVDDKRDFYYDFYFLRVKSDENGIFQIIDITKKDMDVAISTLITKH